MSSATRKLLRAEHLYICPYGCGFRQRIRDSADWIGKPRHPVCRLRPRLSSVTLIRADLVEQAEAKR